MRSSKWAAAWQNQQCGCVPSEDSDQPGHPPSLIRVSAVRMKKSWVLSYPLSEQRRLWSDWADAQADLSLRWAHTYFIGFVMSRLIYCFEAITVSVTTVHCIYRWYKVKHIVGPPWLPSQIVYFRNIFTIKLLTNMSMNGFIMICVKVTLLILCGQKSVKRGILLTTCDIMVFSL